MQATCHIDLKAIGQNYRFFEQRVAPSRIIPVVKANAYGHGALDIVAYLRETFQPELYAVATLEEAVELAAVYPDINILIFSRVFENELHLVPEKGLLTLGSMEDVKCLYHTQQQVHLNVNTGMNRLGISPADALSLINDPKTSLKIAGIYSHYSSSDTPSRSTYLKQTEVFSELASQVKASGFKGMIHLSNSAGALQTAPLGFDAMRLGIGLYGYDTSPEQKFIDQLQPAMEVKAPLIRTDRLPAGAAVSYAEKWIASTSSNIGTLRIGYADGYNRRLTNRGIVTLGQKTFPVIGTVTMDHIMIDLGEQVVPTGTEFTVLGGKEQSPNRIAQVADQLDTISYEICCGISGRVKRVYSS